MLFTPSTNFIIVFYWCDYEANDRSCGEVD